MKSFVLVNSGLESLSQEEIKEILNQKSLSHPLVSEVDVKSKENLLRLVYKSQTARRILLSLGRYTNLEKIDLEKINFPWPDFFDTNPSLKIEVENVKGQENRFEIAKHFAVKLFSLLEKKKIDPKIDFKKPDQLIIIFFNGEEYFIGLDVCGKELNSRHYRVFPHSASFKGDLAYYLVRKVNLNLGDKLMVGFVKDGTLAIEAAIWANCLAVQSFKSPFSFLKFPWFKNFDFSVFFRSHFYSSEKDFKEKKFVIFAFDESVPNVIASRKNSTLAGTKDLVHLQKCALDELDVKYKQNEFDGVILHTTTKDEDKLNEIYYQICYILKPKGKLLLLGRKNWEVSLSTKFKLLKKEEIKRGDSASQLWLLEKR